MKQVGIYCSSNRPRLWCDLIKTLSNNSVDWNLCIAGPKPPIEPLPGNVKYIQTNVKPAQCFFIAEQNTTGDYVMQITDDVTLSNGCIDNLIGAVYHKNIIVSSKYLLGSQHVFRYRLHGKNRNIALGFPMPTVAIMYREKFESIGIDKNYIGLWWDQDVAFELVSKGCKIIINENSTSCDKKGSANLCKVHDDWGYFSDMWFDGKVMRSKRKESIDPLVYTSDILEFSQGNKGHKDKWS